MSWNNSKETRRFKAEQERNKKYYEENGIGVLRAKGKTADHLSHRSAYGGLDTYLYTLMGRTIRLWVFAFKDKYIYTEEKNEF